MCLGMAIRRVKVLREKVQKFAGIVDILFEQDKKNTPQSLEMVLQIKIFMLTNIGIFRILQLQMVTEENFIVRHVLQNQGCLYFL